MIITRILIVAFLLLQVSCSNAESISALHIHYGGQMDMKSLYSLKPVCDKYYRAGLVKHKWKITGDESLLGRLVKDEYWSRDGGHYASYQMSYVATSDSACQYKVVPELNVKYENFLTQTKANYKRSYQDWDSHSEHGLWSPLEAFKAGEDGSGGSLEKESWGISKILTVRGGLAELLKDKFTGEPKSLGKEVVAGKTCESLVAVTKFAESGIDNRTCGWNPEDPNLPDRIILKTYQSTSAGLGGTTIAETINEHAAIPLGLMLPPVMWRDKPEGTYMKSDKTKGKWFDGEQQAQLSQTRGAERRKQKEKRIEQQQQQLIEKLKAGGAL